LMKDTVVRAGFGVYYSPLVSTGRSLFSGLYAMTQSYPTVQPAPGAAPILTLQNPFTGNYKASSSISFFTPETSLDVDKHYSYNLAVERQWRANAITVEFTNKTSIVPYEHNLNAVQPSLTPFSATELPFPALGSVTQESGGARYWYNGLRIDARRRMATGLFFDVTYVYNKTIDDLGGISGERAGSPENPFNRDRDRSRSSILPPHRVTVNYIYQIPFGAGRLGFSNSAPTGRVVNQVVKGWEVAGTYDFSTSPWLNVTGNYLNSSGANYDAPNTNTFSGRPNCTGSSVAPSSAQLSAGLLFNPGAFNAHVGPGSYGTCGKNVLPYGVGYILMNEAFYRNFHIPWFVNREQGANFRVGTQWYNFPNHSNGTNPVTSMSSPLFGEQTNPKNGDTRQILIQARIDF
jgi:trimeric autotransporter adhesin